MFPNIEIVTRKETMILFKDGDRPRSKKYPTKTEKLFYDPTLKIAKDHLIKLKKHEAIIVISQEYTFSLLKLFNYLRAKSIKKVYFFIDDVFRVRHPNVPGVLRSYIIEKDIKNVTIPEIEIILKIIKGLNLEYEIFHCELNPIHIQKKYKLKNIKYFDLFLNNYTYQSIKKGESTLGFNNNINYKLACINYREELHRHLSVAMLYDYRDDMQISLIEKLPRDYVLYNKEIPFESFSLEMQNKLKQNLGLVEKNKIVLKNEDNISKLNHNQVDELKNSKSLLNTMQECFANVVTETRYCSLMPYFSEKTIKTIAVHRPFVLVAQPGTLELLKSLGFKTFDKWWDESYDNEKDHNKRLELVYNTCREILSKDKETLSAMLDDMQDILEHNYNNLFNLTDNMIKLSISM